jgi:Restriction Enzyme Adenine Methylase Associated/GIY-YIG catalytic domain
MRKSSQLVRQHLEYVSGDFLEEYQGLIRGYVSRRQGVYALYDEDGLYYVGLASDLSSRLKTHLKDRHAGHWDRFSVFLTIDDKHLRELETLILHVVRPRPDGNSQIGRFTHSESLQPRLRRDFWRQNRERIDHLVPRGEEKLRAVMLGRMPPLLPYVKRVSKLRGTYKGETHNARVQPTGIIEMDGRFYITPSHAAHAITKHSSNGWVFWKYERAPGDWVRLSELRR